MPFSLEQHMITVIRNCIETSQLKSDKHKDLAQKGFLNKDFFKLESWSIRTRNEAVSNIKRKYLNELISELKGIDGFHVAAGEMINTTYTKNEMKAKIQIATEINLQISQFNGLQFILQNAKRKIDDTISINAAGGESLIALQECEMMLKASISEWIAQLQKDNLHVNGVFPKIFEDSKTRNAGKLFETYVRELIAKKQQIPTGEMYDPTKKDKQQVLLLSNRVSGAFQLPGFTGLNSSSAEPLKLPSENNSKQKDDPKLLTFSQPEFLPIDTPPPFHQAAYANLPGQVDDAAAALRDGRWDANKMPS